MHINVEPKERKYHKGQKIIGEYTANKLCRLSKVILLAHVHLNDVRMSDTAKMYRHSRALKHPYILRTSLRMLFPLKSGTHRVRG